MNQLVTKAVVLSRTDYGEADRIITFLSPEYGKLRLMARGARRVKSKLAGGIELFSVTDVTFIKGRGDIGTLVSSRLDKHYGQIVQNIDRTMAGYELIKRLNKVTEDAAEPLYFELLKQTFGALNDETIPIDLIRLWFSAQLLVIGGHLPNLKSDAGGEPLAETKNYTFSFDDRAFTIAGQGLFGGREIKFLRLLFSVSNVGSLTRINGYQELTTQCMRLIQQLTQASID